MTVISSKISKKVTAGSSTVTVTSTSATGKTTNHMAKELTFTSMALLMRATGSTTSIMALAKRSGRMELFMKVSTKMERSTVKGNLLGSMGALSKGLLSTIRWRDMEYISGAISASMLAYGKTT